MTPAEHYAEAERWIEKAGHATVQQEQTYAIARAQVHATLATVNPNLLHPVRISYENPANPQR